MLKAGSALYSAKVAPIRLPVQGQNAQDAKKAFRANSSEFIDKPCCKDF